MTWIWLAGVFAAWFAMPSPSTPARIILAVCWPVVLSVAIWWGLVMAIERAWRA